MKKTANKSYAGASMDMANHDLWRSPSEESRLAKEGPGDEPQEIPLQNSLGNWVEIERMEPQDTIRTPSYDESVVINIPAGLESGHT